MTQTCFEEPQGPDEAKDPLQPEIGFPELPVESSMVRCVKAQSRRAPAES